jgi:hypothetical protein
MKAYHKYIYLFPVILLMNCDKIDLIDPPGIDVNMQADSIVFAVIGDYGLHSANEEKVALMVKSWNPDFIITSGDNNYPAGEEYEKIQDCLFSSFTLFTRKTWE